MPARLEAIEHRLDVTTLGGEPADRLELNEIGRVRLRLGSPLVADPYEQVRATGAFIVVDSATNDTVGAGMIRWTSAGRRPTRGPMKRAGPTSVGLSVIRSAALPRTRGAGSRRSP